MTVSESAVRKAANDLRELMSQRLGELADELLGRPEFGTPEWVEDRQARDTPEGRERLAVWHLTKIQICREAAVEPLGDVINARNLGVSWERISEAAGVAKETAIERWARYTVEGDQ